MPNIKSAKKRVRVSQRQHDENVVVKSYVKNIIRKYNQLIADGKKNDASKLLPDVYSAIDEAVTKGVITKNSANRKKATCGRALSNLDK
mgnify:CR=1 FL=1